MSRLDEVLPDSPDASAPSLLEGAPKLFTVGTLVYTKQGLWTLFFWLMWNDFTITLLEQVTTVNNLALNKRGASYTLIALFGSMASFMGMWINPFFSTLSDRTRTRYGRRRPFLFIAVPLFAVTLMFIPFTPDLYRFLMGVPWAAALLKHIPALSDPKQAEVLFFGTGCFINQLFNMVVLALFSYFYWDVVPGAVLGRFQAMARVVSSAALIVWNAFIFRYAEFHPKAVYIGVSIFCLTIYLMSLWQVKEGEYPPPQPRATRSPLEPIFTYFKECFSSSYFLWIFCGTLATQVGNVANQYMYFYYLNDLKLSYQQVGYINTTGQTISTLFGVFLGFAIGSMTDRLKPLRILPFLFLARGLVLLIGFFVIKNQLSATIIYTLNEGVVVFCMNVAMGAATVQLFPREKLGQFCSAQAFFYQTILIVGAPLIGKFFDLIQYNRASFLWAAVCHSLAGLIFAKVYFNWKHQRQHLAASA